MEAIYFFEKYWVAMLRIMHPILVRFEKWLVAEHAKVIKGSPIEKAIMYTYKRFNKLSRYHLDGAYNIDNNGIYPNFLVIQNHLLQSLDNAQIMDLKFG